MPWAKKNAPVPRTGPSGEAPEQQLDTRGWFAAFASTGYVRANLLVLQGGLAATGTETFGR